MCHDGPRGRKYVYLTWQHGLASWSEEGQFGLQRKPGFPSVHRSGPFAAIMDAKFASGDMGSLLNLFPLLCNTHSYGLELDSAAKL